MSNPFVGWNPISRKDLHDLVIYAQTGETEKRVKNAKYEYYAIYKNCKSELHKQRELKRISEKYNICEEVILEYVDRQNRLLNM